MLLRKPRLLSVPFPSVAMRRTTRDLSYLYGRARGCDDPGLSNSVDDVSNFVRAHQVVDIEELERHKPSEETSDTTSFGGIGAADPTVAPQHLNDADEVVSVLGRIQRMTEDLFPGPVTLEYASDPEDPSHEYVVFDVVVEGELADYQNRIFQWHDEVERILPETLGRFRLIVHPK